MDTEQLRQFLCVCRIGNITRAADELDVSQPTLSRSIQRLEEELGRPLFERRPRSVEPTDAGVLLQAVAEKVLGMLEDVKAQIADDGQSGRVRVGAIPTIAPYCLPYFLRSFSAEYPRAELVVQEDTTDHLVESCKRGEIDVAVLALPLAEKHLDSQELFREELFLSLPVGHPLTTKKSVRLADVEPYPFVLLGEAHCLSDSVISFCRQRAFQPLVIEKTSQLTTVQELVALGHGVSMIPAMARRIDKSESRVYRSLDGAKPHRTIAMVWNPYRFESRLLKTFRERLVTFSQEYACTDA